MYSAVYSALVVLHLKYGLAGGLLLPPQLMTCAQIMACNGAHVCVAMQAAKELGVAVRGVSFHVGSGATDPEAFREAIQLARTAFDAGTGGRLCIRSYVEPRHIAWALHAPCDITL